MWAVPVLHPAYTFRQPSALGPLEAHVYGFVKRCVEGFPPEPLLLEDPPFDRLLWLLSEAQRRKKAIGVDIECAPPKLGKPEWALFPQWTRLRALGVGADVGKSGVGLSWYWPITRDRRIVHKLQSVFADPKISKVFCNGYAFDVPVLERYGFRVR